MQLTLKQIIKTATILGHHLFKQAFADVCNWAQI